MPPADAELFQRIRDGDQEALEQLLEKYEATILRYGIRICGEREAAREVMQETMLSVAEHAEDFREDANFSTWLWTVARRRCFRIRRKKSGEPLTLQDLESESLEDPNADPERLELGRRLLRALASLSADDQAILLARDVEGRTTTEAAAALGLTENAAKSRLHRARGRLREVLEAG